MKDFRPPERARRPDFPTFVCSSVEKDCGHVCGSEAEWYAPWSPDGQVLRVYCERHKPANAARIPLEARYLLTRVELRVVVPHLPSDPYNAADQAVRKVTDALESVGGLVVGVRVAGEKADESGLDAPPLRLELAGRASPALRPDRPFWGRLEAPPWLRAWKRRKGA